MTLFGIIIFAIKLPPLNFLLVATLCNQIDYDIKTYSVTSRAFAAGATNKKRLSKFSSIFF